jgi:hypothetical protein
MVAKTTGSYVQYVHDDYREEDIYLASLSDADKEWLNDFLRAYYGIEPKYMEKVSMPVEMRRERYRQHRGVKRDIYTNTNRSNPESLLRQALYSDKVEVLDWYSRKYSENEKSKNS